MAKSKEKGIERMAPRIVKLAIENRAMVITYMDNLLDTRGEKPKQVPNKRVDTMHQEPHPDLKRAIDAITPHLAMLTDQIPTKGYATMDDAKVAKVVESYALRSVTFHKKDDDFEGITLGGYRRLQSKRVMNFVAPMVRFQQGSESYEFADQLEEERDKLLKELAAYMDGKYAEPGQITMGFDKAEQDPKEEEEEDEGGEG